MASHGDGRGFSGPPVEALHTRNTLEPPILGSSKAKLARTSVDYGRKGFGDGFELATYDPDCDPLHLAQRTMSVTGDYVFRVMKDFSELCGNDVTAALVFITVTQAVTQHLRVRDAAPADLEGAFFKDALRRPATVSGIAEALGLPVETVRRKAIKLAAAGLMKRTQQGRLMVDTEVLTRADLLEVVFRNRGNADAMRARLGRLESVETRGFQQPPSFSNPPSVHNPLLTARENEVLTWLMEGETTKDVARRLRISPRTVDNFRSRIIRKMKVKNIAAVATRVARQGDEARSRT